MSKGFASLSKTLCEWGSKARKEEDRLRGMRGRANRDHILEGLEELDNES